MKLPLDLERLARRQAFYERLGWLLIMMSGWLFICWLVVRFCP